MTGGQPRLYFDHNATAPLLAEAREAMVRALEMGGNPSSVHTEGRRARETVEEARAEVAALVGADPDGVIFTSGATEAANLALTPRWQREGRPLALSGLAAAATDHPCVLEGGRFEAGRLTRLPVDTDGRLDPKALQMWAEETPTGLIALSLANNESGVVQPLDPVWAVLGQTRHLLLLDVVQAVARMPVDLAGLAADAAILSGHKIGAASGVGALVLRDAGTAPEPLVRGGAQERRLRAGTEAVAAIAGFGAAARLARSRADSARKTMLWQRERLEATILATDPDALVIGQGAQRLPNTILLAAPGLKGETAQIALDLQGFAVSSGSACSSGKVAVSPVLAAHAAAGLGIDPALGALRLSFGFDTTDEDIDAMAQAVARLLHRAMHASGRSRAA